MFDEQAIKDPTKNLAKFYKTCVMCKPNDVTND